MPPQAIVMYIEQNAKSLEDLKAELMRELSGDIEQKFKSNPMFVHSRG